MYLIAGLGNPGAEYAGHRHNVGFMAIDHLADGGVHFSKKFQSEAAQITLGDAQLLLLKPQTYMNHSGRAVQAAMAFYKIPPAQLIVMYDELDLPVGKLRIKQGGGANGHNGIKDIDAAIGPDYWRIRLGINHPGTKEQVHGHVLSNFAKDEVAPTQALIAALTKHFPLFWQHSPEALATKVAAELLPPRAKKPGMDKPPATD
ncbi:MAG: aminoacyl-tRNA hydrolase [Rickettsiales bacterium]